MHHLFGYCPTIEQYHHELCHAPGAFYSSGFSEATTLSVDDMVIILLDVMFTSRKVDQLLLLTSL